jgi:hypothetical protein
MKKLSLVAIKNALVGFGYEDAEILSELDKEINKGEAQKEANAKVYDSFHDIVMGTLSAVPVTIAELWESIKDEVPAGVTKGKVQYAVTHLWVDEIVKIEGNPNTYRKA